LPIVITDGTAAIAGHGSAVGRLRDEGGGVVAGPDEDALTLATEAGFQALGRAGGGPVPEILLAAPVCSPADAETLLAALRLDDSTAVRRVPDALEAVALALEHGGRTLVAGSDGSTGGALVVDGTGYATARAAQVGGGAALADRTRDPRFDRHAGLTSVLRRAGAKTTATSPLVDAVRLLDARTEGTIASGGPARVSTLTLTDRRSRCCTRPAADRHPPRHAGSRARDRAAPRGSTRTGRCCGASGPSCSGRSPPGARRAAR
jgi:hypothetical protein